MAIAHKGAVDAEAWLTSAPPHNKAELRLWLRLFSTSRVIEQSLRARLRAEFGCTMPRFDLMAQLRKEPEGLALGALSRRMMVSAGNVTGLTERLVGSGHVVSSADPDDGRAQRVRLTEKGRAEFDAMALAHERWIVELFGELSAQEIQEALGVLSAVKQSARHALADNGE